MSVADAFLSRISDSMREVFLIASFFFETSRITFNFSRNYFSLGIHLNCIFDFSRIFEKWKWKKKIIHQKSPLLSMIMKKNNKCIFKDRSIQINIHLIHCLSFPKETTAHVSSSFRPRGKLKIFHDYHRRKSRKSSEKSTSNTYSPDYCFLQIYGKRVNEFIAYREAEGENSEMKSQHCETTNQFDFHVSISRELLNSKYCLAFIQRR